MGFRKNQRRNSACEFSAGFPTGSWLLFGGALLELSILRLSADGCYGMRKAAPTDGCGVARQTGWVSLLVGKRDPISGRQKQQDRMGDGGLRGGAMEEDSEEGRGGGVGENVRLECPPINLEVSILHHNARLKSAARRHTRAQHVRVARTASRIKVCGGPSLSQPPSSPLLTVLLHRPPPLNLHRPSYLSVSVSH